MFYSKNLKINNIQHCFFSKKNGVSSGIYESLNCGIGSRDLKENVKKNLKIVSEKFNIQTDSLIMMQQTHSNKVEIIKEDNISKKVKCDAMITKSNKIALGVLTADCVPILIYEKNKNIIGCIHAGWKGAFTGIIENTVDKIKDMDGDIEKLIFSIGPCISKENYEVKEDFYSKFIKSSKNNEIFFYSKDNKSLNFDLRGFINKKIKDIGVQEVENINIDTYASHNDYFSHRRAKKLGQDDYGRCISVIKKPSLQN